MNSQERDQLSRFLQQLTDVQLTAKDQEAAAMIGEAASRQPDASYLLVQRALLLDQALNVAKLQISELQQQLQAGARAQSQNGFLNNDPWTQSATQSAAVPGAGNYQMPRSVPQQPQPQPQAGGGGFMGGAGSSFLGNVATTAAGVVAGSFLFQGIGSLMGHHSPSPWGQQSTELPGEHVKEEYTTINNYYGDDAKSSDLHTASYDETSADDDDNSYDNDGESDWM